MNSFTSEHLQGLMSMLQAEKELTQLLIDMLESGQISITVGD